MALSKKQHDEAIRLRIRHRWCNRDIADRVGVPVGQISRLFCRLRRDGVVHIPPSDRGAAARRRKAEWLNTLRERAVRVTRTQYRQAVRSFDLSE